MAQQQTTGVLDPASRWAELTVVPDGVALHEAAPAIDPVEDAEPTDQEIEDGVRELAKLGLITLTADSTDTIVGYCVRQGILDAQRDLHQAQIDLAATVRARVAAKLAEETARAKHAEKVALATAALYEAGLTGSNERARTADLEARLVYDGAVSAATWLLAHATAARIAAEGEERIADTKHKALRAELTALGQLVAAS